MFSEDAAKDTLEKVMEEALSQSGVKRSAVRAVCLGVSGVNHLKDEERVLNWIRYGIFLFKYDLFYIIFWVW